MKEPYSMPKPRESIDSHQSFFTNRRLDYLFMNIDRMGIMASNSPHLMNITSYFNSCEQVYINSKDILIPTDVVILDQTRDRYYAILRMIENNPKCRTRKAVLMLLAEAKRLNTQIISSLQKFSYFFRTSSKHPKGLRHISFFSQSVFGNQRGGTNADEPNKNSEESEGEVSGE